MNDKYITCPNCGKQYLPSEIFIPSAFFGKPRFIQRDENGKIIDIIGVEPDIEELYCCDNCETSFSITTKIQFETKVDIQSDFSHDYETRLNK